MSFCGWGMLQLPAALEVALFDDLGKHLVSGSSTDQVRYSQVLGSRQFAERGQRLLAPPFIQCWLYGQICVIAD